MAASVTGVSALAIAAIFLLSFAPFISFAAGSTVTVQSSAASYPTAVAGTSIPITGIVTPAPGVAGYSVTVELSNPSGLFIAQSGQVNPTTGAYNTTFVSGTPAALWGNGTYTVTAVYATSAQSTPVTGSATFTYGSFATSTTTSSTSSTGSTGSSTSIKTITTVVNFTTKFTTTVVTTISQATTVTQGGTTLTSIITQGGTTLTSIITQGGTTITQGGTTLTSIITQGGTTVTSGNSTTAEAIGAVGVVIAIIAGAIAVMALRKH